MTAVSNSFSEDSFPAAAALDQAEVVDGSALRESNHSSASERRSAAVPDINARVELSRPDALVRALISERRSGDAVDALSREMNDACTRAVSHHQIAALLEAEGLNDRIVRERYARPSVFALAAELYERVPLRSPVHRPERAALSSLGPQPSTMALIMRGPIYLAPVVFLAALGQQLTLQPLLWAGLLALLLAWAWNQGLGALVHRLIGRGNTPAAERMTRFSLAAGVASVTLAVWAVSALLVGTGSIVLFTAGQTAYLIAAASLLTLGRDRLLIFALLPGLVIAAASILVSAMPDWTAVAATGSALLLVIVTMVWTTRRGRRARLQRLTRSDVSLAAVHALLGLTWASLIGLAGFSIFGTSDVLATVGLASAGMVLTMGVAEWQLLSLRRRVRLALVATADPKEFSRRARRAFARAAGVFMSALIAATTLISVGIESLGSMTRLGAVLAFAFVWLGFAFFAGLALDIMGRIAVPLWASLICVAAIAGYLVAPVSDDPLVSAGVYAAACVGLCVVLVVSVGIVIPRVVGHR